MLIVNLSSTTENEKPIIFLRQVGVVHSIDIFKFWSDLKMESALQRIHSETLDRKRILKKSKNLGLQSKVIAKRRKKKMKTGKSAKIWFFSVLDEIKLFKTIVTPSNGSIFSVILCWMSSTLVSRPFFFNWRGHYSTSSSLVWRKRCWQV